MDPKTFYNSAMPEKYGPEYEKGRWGATPLLQAQYHMMQEVMTRMVLPVAANCARITEVGPGPGTWSKRLLEAHPTASYTVVDISSEMLSQARQALSAYEQVTFIESDFAAYRPEQQSDFFFSSRAIEYMPDKKQMAESVARVLSPGGCGVIITKTPKPGLDRLKRRKLSALHQGQIPPRELARVLGEAGLIVDGCRIATATVPGMRSVMLNKLAFSALCRIPLFSPLVIFSESYLLRFHKPV
jgi:SAM-dependent methyltransferase